MDQPTPQPETPGQPVVPQVIGNPQGSGSPAFHLR